MHSDYLAAWQPGETPESPLVVICHGFWRSAGNLADSVAAARAAIPGCAILAPRLPYAAPLSCASPAVIAGDLVATIDRIWQQAAFSRLVLVGHSMGSLIARKVAVLACGETTPHAGRDASPAPFEPDAEPWRQPRAWSGRIERLVLLAGMSRGWATSAAHDWLTLTIWNVLIFIGDVIGGRWSVLRCRKGAPFVVQTRLQWLSLQRDQQRNMTVVQLIGANDDTVAPDETVDFVIDSTSATFVILLVPQTDHARMMDFSVGPGAPARAEAFAAALTAPAAQLAAHPLAIPEKFITNGPPLKANSEVTDVVFVIHGIRDNGFWTQKVAINVMQEASRSATRRELRSMTLSYGYLGMGPFVLGPVRREKARWLMDRYADYRARYPNARFCYIGHSNGTYLAAHALECYPAARFERVVFAGSVVRPGYPWKRIITGPYRQVDAVLNYVASNDLVVAIFPNGLSRFGDLGGAGHRGFDDLGHPQRSSPGASLTTTVIGPAQSHQLWCVAGGHGAGVRESQWRHIARFVIEGEAPSPQDPEFVGSQKLLARIAGILPPVAMFVVVALAIAALSGLGVLLAAGLARHLPEPAAITLAIVAMIALTSTIVTRV